MRSNRKWGSRPAERDLIIRLHRTKEDIPDTGVVVDATAPLEDVVDEILRHAGLSGDQAWRDSSAAASDDEASDA